MFTLAKRNLFHDKLRLAVTLTGIVFAVVLIVIELGLFVGFTRTTSALIDHSHVDLWVTSSHVPYLELGVPMNERKAYQVEAVPGVAGVEKYIVRYTRWNRLDGGQEQIQVIGFDPDRSWGGPWNVVEGDLRDLRIPDGIMVDDVYKKKLGVTRIGEVFEINGHRARVVGFTHDIRSFTTAPCVFTSFRNALDYVPRTIAMKSTGPIFLLSIISITTSAHAQFGNGIVFDPTQSGHAIEQIRQAEQMYTTAEQTRTTIVSAYNLARQMANLPNSLYQRYATPWTVWRNVAAGNTYGNVQGWVNAANTGLGVILGYEAATINVAPRYPLYQQLGPEGQRIVASQAATADLGDGIVESNLQTLGTMRTNSEARESDIRQMESETYSNDPAQHTDMATLQRINQATLMQLRAQQDANQIAQAAALQQIVSQRQQQDALKAAFQDAAEYQQQYSTTVQPLTSGYGNSMSQTH